MQRQIQEIQDLATKYSKADLGRMVQLGLLDAQKAMMAGMMIQRIEQQNMKPPQSTVAQEVLGLPTLSAGAMQPTPQLRGSPGIGTPPAPPLMMAASGGVTSIPAGDVGEYAGGGIVAFDEGGEVPGYNGNDGSFVDYGIPISYGGVAGGEEFFKKPVMPYGEQMRNIGSSIINGLRRIVSDPAMDEKDRAAAKAKLDQIAATNPTDSSLQADVRRIDNQIDARQAPPAAVPAVPTLRKEGKGPAAGAVESTIKRPEINLPSTTIPLQTYKAAEPKELGEYGKERTDYMQSMGVDPEMYAKMIKGVEEKKGKLEKRKGEVGGEALMMAGLGLIGARRGQEFQALGEAGRTALSAYKQDVKELRAADEKYDERIEALRMADQTAKQTGAEKDITRRDAAVTKVEEAEKDRVRAANEAAKSEAQLRMQGAQIETQAGVSMYGTDVGAQTAAKQLEVQRQQVANQAAYYSKSIDLTKQRIKAMDAATQARFMTATQKIVEGMQSDPTYISFIKQLKGDYGDKYASIPEVQRALDNFKKTYVGQQLESMNMLVPSARDATALIGE